MSKEINKKILDKSGGELLQTLLVLVIIGALVITICSIVSKSFKSSGEKVVTTVTDGALETINNALSTKTEDISGIE